MFSELDEQYILRHLSQSNLTLFLGAGFSAEAKNALNQYLPVGQTLAKAIWDFMRIDGDYDGESVGEMYEALLASSIEHAKIRNFLESHLICRDIPQHYDGLVGPYWRRIYTTNVDDLVSTVYGRAHSKLEVLAYPSDEMSDRDQSLKSIQLVHLNGRLPCRPTEITFSPRQYAKAGNRPQPLYEQFVRDFAVHPVIFVGTQLNEPLFLQALEARQGRLTDISENRPKSYLVARRISAAKLGSLAEWNVVPVQAETRDFLDWLARIRPALPSRIDVIRKSSPDLAELIESTSKETVAEKDLTAFGASFGLAPVEPRSSNHRSVYLLGAAPRWEDLFLNLDAARSLTPHVRSFVEGSLKAEGGGPFVAAILGSAGSGKSTILRRVGIQLRQAGHLVYATNSESLPSPDVIRRVLDQFDERVILLMDNAEIALSVLPDLIKGVRGCVHAPVIMFASRTNDFDRLWSRLAESGEIKEFNVPHLSRPEIEALIEILEREGLLGNLRGLSKAQRIQVFEGKAQKQILIAMREATTSQGFDLIIKDEFQKLVPEESQLLYLCVALATDAGYRLTKEEFVACSRVPPSEALHYLTRNLRDIVVPTGTADSLLLLRHRLLAELALANIAPRPLLREAYIRLLVSLAPEVRASGWRSRVSGLARSLWNHKTVYSRFRNSLEEARSVFSALKDWFGGEAHFWLQYGNLELEGQGGDLNLAENYLRQAESLDETDPYIQNAIGHLLLRKATYAEHFGEALELLKQGRDHLLKRIDDTDCDDPYCVHILCAQSYHWCQIWYHDDDAKRRVEFEKLAELLKTATRKHPRHIRLRKLNEVIQKATLQLAIPASIRPEPPTIPELDEVN